MNLKMPRRLKLIITYDGRPFCGWQSQAGGGSVQDHLETALFKICARRIIVHGSGRTDAGVHALAQVAHIEAHRAGMTSEQWKMALNAHLPKEIRVTSCRWARPDFHARFSATGKIYHYRIWNGTVLPPLEIGRVWPVFSPVDMDVLRQCAKMLVGRHDFAAFAANRGVPNNDTVRTIRRIDIKGKAGGLITLTFKGDGFLYKMVRLLTGSLIRVARGKADPEWLVGLLAVDGPGKPKIKTSFGAPAEGLYLARVLYSGKESPVIDADPATPVLTET